MSQTVYFDGFELTDFRDQMNIQLVTSWLQSSYWHKNLTEEQLQHSMNHSALVAGAFLHGEQVGFLRVVSDCFRFAYLCDVWIAEEHRGKGLGVALTRYALEHPKFSTVGHWLLATKDAQRVYEKVGFGPLEEVETYMRLLRGKSSACGAD